MKTIVKNVFRGIGILLLVIVLALTAFIWFGTLRPAAVENAAVTCPGSAPTLDAGQSLKVLTWNVQTMSGKNHVFWSDLPGNDGPDEKPTPEEITQALSEVARVIKAEDPDIVLIQEIDNGAERTYYEDQLARLMELLPGDYACSTSAFDWKAAYVPHARIHGSVGWKVAILSKYQISAAERRQLAVAPTSLVRNLFIIRPAILEAHLPITQGGEFVALTLHLDLYVPGTDTKDVQIAQIDDLLSGLTDSGTPWILGGDFNLLPFDDAAYGRLPAEQQHYYDSKSEIKLLFDHYQALPTTAELTGHDYAQWFTRFPNVPSIAGPDRTLDYMFLPPSTSVSAHHVRQEDTLKISDHLPLISVIQLP